DHHSARRLRDEIDMEVFRQLPRTLTLDLSGVGFMDSAGLGLILGRLNLMTGRMGVLRLSGLNPPVARILSLAGVERLPGLKLPEPDRAQPAGAI
ncbi:MAG: anti-sigma factor antagonist, partial [Clostridia bacterium]|nr:anti-sigma factor antagonist [Clostridia bacterium]